MADDDLEDEAGDSDSRRIDALEEEVAQLRVAFQNIGALHMVSEARLHAIRRLIVECPQLLGLNPMNPLDLSATLQAMEREACEIQLGHAADSNPRVATILKEMIDRLLSPDPRT